MSEAKVDTEVLKIEAKLDSIAKLQSELKILSERVAKLESPSKKEDSVGNLEGAVKRFLAENYEIKCDSKTPQQLETILELIGSFGQKKERKEVNEKKGVPYKPQESTPIEGKKQEVMVTPGAILSFLPAGGN